MEQNHSENHGFETPIDPADISTQDWISILNRADQRNKERQINALLMFFRQPEHKATCGSIGKEYDIKPTGLNSLIWNFGRDSLVHLGKSNGQTEGKYWPIPMIGEETNDGFEWTVRPNLCEALVDFLASKMVSKYKEIIIADGIDNSIKQELYKWKVIKECQGKSTHDILEILLSPTCNFIEKAHVGATMNEILKSDSSSLTKVFDILRTEKPIEERISDFSNSAKSITPEGKTSFGDERTAAAFLTCIDPGNFTPYISSLYDKYCKYIGEQTKAAKLKYAHFLDLLEIVDIKVKEDSELQEELHNQTKDYFWSDMLNAQDVVWQTIDYFSGNMSRNWLQRMYDECLRNNDMFKPNGWFSGYKQTVERFRTAIIESENSIDCLNIVDDLILKQANNIADVGLGGKFNKEDYPIVKNAWPQIFPILKNCLIKNEISQQDYSDVNIIAQSLNTKRKHPAAFNRMWSGLFPNYISTTSDRDSFCSVYGYLHHNFDLKESSGNWLIDNIEIIKYLNKKVEFKDPWHSSLFVWFLTYCINSEEKTTNMDKYIALLKDNYNLILTGAPGTGKTHMAMQIAEEMQAEVKFVQFHPSYDYTDFVEGLRPIEGDGRQIGFERKDGVFKEFCKRAIKNLVDSQKSVENLSMELTWKERLDHFIEEAYNYGTEYETLNGSKFTISEINGRNIIAHNEKNEKVTDISVNLEELEELLTSEVKIEYVGDIHKHFQKKYPAQSDSYAYAIINEIRQQETEEGTTLTAEKVSEKTFVFIIDEINRGEASKIFGELFYAIDKGYRGNTKIKVDTQYQNLVPKTDVFADGFYVPKNVYILGTMNDIDRSVESMDFAMRRRFTWMEVTPDERANMLTEVLDPELAEDARVHMTRLNDVIEMTEGLGSAYKIGPAYFLKLETNDGDFEDLWKMNIKPLLKEYLRGFRKADETMIEFENAYYGKKDSKENNSDSTGAQ